MPPSVNKSGITEIIIYTIEVKIDLLSFILNILKNNDEYSKQVIIVFIVCSCTCAASAKTGENVDRAMEALVDKILETMGY